MYLAALIFMGFFGLALVKEYIATAKQTADRAKIGREKYGFLSAGIQPQLLFQTSQQQG
jgi:hypothetical protein